MIDDHGNVEGTNLTVPVVERTGNEGDRLWHSVWVVLVLSGLLVVTDQHEVCAVWRHTYGAIDTFDRSRRERCDWNELLREWSHVGDEWVRDGMEQDPR